MPTAAECSGRINYAWRSILSVVIAIQRPSVWVYTHTAELLIVSNQSLSLRPFYYIRALND